MSDSEFCMKKLIHQAPWSIKLYSFNFAYDLEFSLCIHTYFGCGLLKTSVICIQWTCFYYDVSSLVHKLSAEGLNNARFGNEVQWIRQGETWSILWHAMYFNLFLRRHFGNKTFWQFCAEFTFKVVIKLTVMGFKYSMYWEWN